MNAVRRALEAALEGDAVLSALVGRDPQGDPKVYEQQAKKDLEPPFVVWNLLPGPEPEGHFGDDRAVEIVEFQVSSWGRTKDEAWDLFSASQDALEIHDWDVELTPYKMMRLHRMGDQHTLQDPDVPYIHIPSTYRVWVSR